MNTEPCQMNPTETFQLESLQTNPSYKNFLLSLLDKLATYHTQEEKIYIGGGIIDPNQSLSLSEKQFLRGMLGVIASSEKIGNVLINIIGMIIDNNYGYILDMYQNCVGKDEVTVTEMIDYLYEDWKGWNTTHSLIEKSIIKLSEDEHVIVYPKKMNLWNLTRVREFISEEQDFGF